MSLRVCSSSSQFCTHQDMNFSRICSGGMDEAAATLVYKAKMFNTLRKFSYFLIRIIWARTVFWGDPQVPHFGKFFILILLPIGLSIRFLMKNLQSGTQVTLNKTS